MLQHTLDIDPSLHITVQHSSDQINAVIAHNIRHSQIVIHDFVNAVEWVLLIDNGIQKDAKGPNILLLAAVRMASENFRGGVVYELTVLVMYSISEGK